MQVLCAVISLPARNPPSSCFSFFKPQNMWQIIPTSTSAAAYAVNPYSTVGSAQVELVDSGSTRTASGDRSLFPADLYADRITHRIPIIQHARQCYQWCETARRIHQLHRSANAHRDNSDRVARRTLHAWPPLRYSIVDEGSADSLSAKVIQGASFWANAERQSATIIDMTPPPSVQCRCAARLAQPVPCETVRMCRCGVSCRKT
eukprot:1250853-Pleurochrysis_carterae.AAC.1